MVRKIKREKALSSIKAYLPGSEIIDIIEMCDLYSLKHWKHWSDLMGNHIKVINKTDIRSISNSSDNEDKIVTDLYYRSPPDLISRKSKKAFISFGIGNNCDIAFLWFLGKDNRLRLLSITDNKWNKNQPPLMCGLDTLRPIVRSLNVKDYCRADILRVVGPDAAKITRSWSTEWPPSDRFKQKILSFNEKLSLQIINDCEV